MNSNLSYLNRLRAKLNKPALTEWKGSKGALANEVAKAEREVAKQRDVAR